MKTYYYLIKSHTEAPDVDGEVEAENKKEACKKIIQGWEDWDEDMVKDDVVCEKCFENPDLMVEGQIKMVCPHG